MSLYRRAAKRDGNEAILREYCEAAGASWQSLSVPGGPDAICAYGNRVALIEVKQPKTGRLTKAQKDWRMKWKGPKVWQLETLDDAKRLIRWVRESPDGERPESQK